MAPEQRPSRELPIEEHRTSDISRYMLHVLIRESCDKSRIPRNAFIYRLLNVAYSLSKPTWSILKVVQFRSLTIRQKTLVFLLEDMCFRLSNQIRKWSLIFRLKETCDHLTCSYRNTITDPQLQCKA